MAITSKSVEKLITYLCRAAMRVAPEHRLELPLHLLLSLAPPHQLFRQNVHPLLEVLVRQEFFAFGGESPPEQISKYYTIVVSVVLATDPES